MILANIAHTGRRVVRDYDIPTVWSRWARSPTWHRQREFRVQSIRQWHACCQVSIRVARPSGFRCDAAAPTVAFPARRMAGGVRLYAFDQVDG